MKRRLLAPFPALPLDLFRVAAGLLALAYFTGELLSFADFTASGGLLDHELIARMWWFTRLSLFQPGAPDLCLKAALALGWLACWGVILGVAIRPCAAAAFLVAASLFRWNLPVMEIDDSIVDLLLFWLLLLPTGSTLTLGAWRKAPAGAWKRWRDTWVPGAAPRLFMANALLIYLVAGFSKLGSPLWLSGLGFYAVLELPVSRTAGIWLPGLELSVLNYAAMALEITLPFLLLAPSRTPLKRMALFLQASFHLGIVVLFGLPYVSLALLASGLLFGAGEFWGAPPREAPAPWTAGARAGAALVALLALAGMRGLPVAGALEAPAQVLLWLGGLCQDYHLFNWIGRVGYRTHWQPPLFPDGSRGFVAQAYLLDLPWVYAPCSFRPAWKAAILQRAANRACRGRPDAEGLDSHVWTQRIAPEGGLEGRFLMEFDCRGGKAELRRAFDVNEPGPECRPGVPQPLEAVIRL